MREELKERRGRGRHSNTSFMCQVQRPFLEMCNTAASGTCTHLPLRWARYSPLPFLSHFLPLRLSFPQPISSPLIPAPSPVSFLPGLFLCIPLYHSHRIWRDPIVTFVSIPLSFSVRKHTRNNRSCITVLGQRWLHGSENARVNKVINSQLQVALWRHASPSFSLT